MGKSSRPPRNPQAGTDRKAKIEVVAAQGRGGVNKIIVATVVAVVAIIAVVTGVILNQRSATDAITAGGKAVPAGTTMGQGLPAFTDATVVTGAPTLEVFEDFQCPACKIFEDAMGETIAKLGTEGKVKVVYHIKTFLDDNLRNDSSMRSGIGALCAADAGKFQPYHDAVYANQPAKEGDGWSDAQLRSFAEGAGISGAALTTWDACVKAKKYENYLTAVEEQSGKDGVTRTPTLRLNGKDVELKALVAADGKSYDPAKLTEAITAATTK
mgnify:CR=1 FL=1